MIRSVHQYVTEQLEAINAAIAEKDKPPSNQLPGGNSEWAPPDPIPNSEVKLLSADDSAGPPRVRVGHCQAFNINPEGH